MSLNERQKDACLRAAEYTAEDVVLTLKRLGSA